jgi:hypothetical protein
MARKELEQRKLTRTQLDLPSGSAHVVSGRIDHEITDCELSGPICGPPANQCPQPRQQLTKRERLDEVVIRAGIESAHPIVELMTSGQHQDRRPHPILAERSAYGEPVESREHHIEHDRVIFIDVGVGQRQITARHNINRVALAPKPSRNSSRQLWLVFSYQYPHGDRRVYSHVRESTMNATLDLGNRLDDCQAQAGPTCGAAGISSREALESPRSEPCRA